MNVGIISKDKGGGDLKAKAGEEEWSADSEPDSPPSPGDQSGCAARQNGCLTRPTRRVISRKFFNSMLYM